MPAVLALIIFYCAQGCFRSGQSHNEEDMPYVGEALPETESDSSVLGFDPDTMLAREGRVKSGEFFSVLLGRLGMRASEAYNLSSACDGIFDVKSLKSGNTYHAYYADGGECPEFLVYEKDMVNSVVFRCRPPYEIRNIARKVERERKYADVTIETSLWNDMTAAGVSSLLILELSDVYAWTVDFFGLQKGDRFRVYYDQTVCEGDVLAVDSIRYAVFTHGGEDFCSVMFDQKDGGNLYWNEKGESMRKAFLKAPLQYSRISSGFSYSRRHPITRKVQPHTGVDYAAPKGTPVMSIGDGVVTSMKYEGAGGNVVRIRHNSVYSTAYLHLSRYASGLKAGKRVRQGDVIGYVGSTGRSTGPHLDFRVWKNGSPINPLKMESPPAEPVREENMEAFMAAVKSYRMQMDTIRALEMAERLFNGL